MSVTVETLIEAALLTSESPLTDKQLRQLWTPTLPQDALVDVLVNLQARWSQRALQLVETVEGWRFQIVAEAFSELKEKLEPEKAPRYSRAVLETLAIIAYQQPVSVCQVIDRAKAQSFPPTRIIVVDNGSNDQSASQVANAHPDVELMRLPTNRGVGFGHNVGWRLALEDPNCEFIWALEHDCFPHVDCLSQLVQAHRTLFIQGASELPGIVASAEENARSTSSNPHYLMTAFKARMPFKLDVNYVCW